MTRSDSRTSELSGSLGSLDERTAAIAEPGRFVAELERVNASWGVLRDFQWIEEKGERVLEVEFDEVGKKLPV